MSDDIQAVQKHLDEILAQLQSFQAAGCHIRVALVLYRDHVPKEEFVTRVQPFTTDLQKVRDMIMAIKAKNGGDEPEAVYEGIFAALQELQWSGDLRSAIVIGDAPPHPPSDGLGSQSPFWLGLAAKSRDIQVNLYPILVGK
jgi:hypothetical protein